MKKIEAIIQPDSRDAVVSAIKKLKVGGITVHPVQGQGAEDPPLVGQFMSKEMVMCVVDDEKLDEILNAIADTACTSTKGDGKVFVTTIDEAIDICTKRRGISSI